MPEHEQTLERQSFGSAGNFTVVIFKGFCMNEILFGFVSICFFDYGVAPR